jgi:hypothetical protein
MLREASPALAAQADRIQVFDRLKHHLDPRQFPPRAYVGYAALVVIWLALRRSAARTEAEAFFTRYVLGCTLIALAGLAIGWCDWPTAIMRQPGLMKFYPFRLADAFIPMAAAVTAAACAARWLQEQPEGQAAEKLPRRTAAISLLFAAAFVWSLAAPAVDRNPGRMSPERTADWLAICRWIERETHPDALFWVKGDGFGFKWYAARAEFFSVKDCPQDAAGIVAWHDHIRQLFEWDQRQPQGKYSAAALSQLHRETAIDYVVARPHEFEPRPVYQNDSFAVLKASVQ